MASYTKFEDGDLLVGSEKVSTPIWTGNKSTISGSELTASNEGSFSSDFFIDYTITPSGSSVAEVQLSVAYADKDGSGSAAYTQDDALARYSPSSTMYGQYRSLVLGNEESDFFFESGVSSSNFWVISLDRARYKEALMPGTFELSLSGSNISGSTLVLRDEGSINPGATTRYIDSGRVYSIYGAASAGTPTEDWVEGYGYFLPDIGTILIDCAKVLTSAEQNTVRYDSVSDSPLPSSDTNVKVLMDCVESIALKAEETVTSNYVWVRVKNSQFNYSMNPSFVTDSGEIKHNIMINSPEVYITSVGLYNSNNDLLAVAKLSRPLVKSFSREALIRIKLDY